MIELSTQELEIVKNICVPYKDRFDILVFGSRYTGNTHDHSDLDLAIKGSNPVDILLMAELKDAFEASDLPFRADIVDFHRMSPEFQKIVLKNSTSLWKVS